MKRRSFLKGIIAAVAVAACKPAVPAPALPAAEVAEAMTRPTTRFSFIVDPNVPPDRVYFIDFSQWRYEDGAMRRDTELGEL